MPEPRLRALVLAAGRGERLRPLSDFLPKPLLPIAGRPVAGHSLAALRAAGCEAVAINLHHLGDQIRAAFGDSFDGMPITYSPERELQGTLGALYPLRDFLGGAELVLLINGDSHCRWPLRRLVRRHRQRGAQVTLLLSRRARPGDYDGGVGIDREGRVVELRGSPARGEVAARWVYAGAHTIEPELLGRVPEGPGDLIAGLYAPLLAQGARIESVTTRRPWHDLGTPRRYLEAVLERAGVAWRGSRVERGARIGRGARLWRSVVGEGAAIESPARVEASLLFAGTRVGERAAVRGAILGPGVDLPAGTAVDGRLLTPLRAGVAPGPRDSVVGGLVFTPVG